jgi:predicted membrane-bound mannosyltransferase
MLTAALFFSSFGTHPRGLLDALKAYAAWGHRAGGGVHRQPPWFYLGLLLRFRKGPGPTWSEAVIVIPALVGGLAAWRGRLPTGVRPGPARFLAAYTAVLTLLYSLIPYKTPWCLLSFLYGMTLLAGIGVVFLFQRAHRPLWRLALAAALTAGTWRLGRACLWSIGRYCTSPRNPYVYAQTVGDVPRLARRLRTLALARSEGTALRIHVIAPPEETWPLPWYLRGFSRTGYWTAATPDALAGPPPILITSLAIADRLPQRLRAEYEIEYYGLRPDVLLVLHIRHDITSAEAGQDSRPVK